MTWETIVTTMKVSESIAHLVMSAAITYYVRKEYLSSKVVEDKLVTRIKSRIQKAKVLTNEKQANSTNQDQGTEKQNGSGNV